MEQNPLYEGIVPVALSYLKDQLQHKYSSCGHYYIGWTLLKAFMDERDIVVINPLVCQQYVGYLADLAKIRELSPKEKRSVKSVTVLSEFISTGIIERRRQYKFLEGSIGMLIQEYLLSKMPLRLSSVTLRQMERNLSRFNFWLTLEHVCEISLLKHEHIVNRIEAWIKRKLE